MVAYPRNEQSLVKKRMEVVFLLYLGLAGVLGARLVYLQAAKGREFSKLAAEMQGRVFQIDARRGSILDRDGNELATDVLAKAIIINPRVISDPAATAARLGKLLGLDQKETAEMQERIARGKEKKQAYAKLRRGVERRLADHVLALSKQEQARIEKEFAAAQKEYVKAQEAAKKDPSLPKPEAPTKGESILKGIWLEDTPQRVNPSGADALQLLGPVNIDGMGLEGMELYAEKVLRGHNGKRTVRVSAMGEPVPTTEGDTVAPVDGKDIRLTINRDIQHFVEAELAKVAKEQSPDGATAIVMDVRNGQVLAMANWPTYGPKQAKISPEARRNRAITDLFEPGSIFKVITAAGALEKGVPTTTYCGGSWAIGNRSVRCAHGASHGACDLRKMIEKSCNIGAGMLAWRMGAPYFYQFLSDFGFSTKTGVEFPGEEYALLSNPAKRKWAPMRTANIGFGQGIAVTPIQMVTAYAAIANDGVYNPPRLILDAPGMELPKRAPHRVMSAANAAALRSHMEAVVTSGTGTAAKIARYSAAGKTGTAQIAKNGRYGHGYVASFAGFVPATRPRLAILVSVWHPRKGQYGGVVSAPVFREISRQCVSYLRIPPDVPNDLRDGRDPGSFHRGGHAAAGGHND